MIDEGSAPVHFSAVSAGPTLTPGLNRPRGRDHIAELFKKANLEYSSFTTEEQGCISHKIEKLVAEGKDHDQAIAIAISMCAPSKVQKSAAGGATGRPSSPCGCAKYSAGATYLPLEGYRAEQASDGTWTIFDVPIFAEHVDSRNAKAPISFTRAWLDQAIKSARAREGEGYLPPLHIYHHGQGVQTIRAGHYRPKRRVTIQYQGRPVEALLADLVKVTPEAYADVKAGKVPYVSVEIHPGHLSEANAEIDSLALLPDEVPFFRFPLLKIASESRANSDGEGTRSGAPAVYAVHESPVLAFRAVNPNSDSQPSAAGASVLLRFTEESMNLKDPDPAGSSSDEKKPEVQKADAPPAADASGKILAILEQIAAKLGIGGGAAPAAAAPIMAANASGGKASAFTGTAAGAQVEAGVHYAALEGEIRGLTAKISGFEKRQQTEDLVKKAEKDLDGLALGAEWKNDVRKYAELGEKALDAFVSGVKKSAPKLPGAGSAATGDGAADAPDAPEVAIFAKYGADALNTARGLAKEYSMLPSHLRTHSLASFLEVQPEVRRYQSAN